MSKCDFSLIRLIYISSFSDRLRLEKHKKIMVTFRVTAKDEGNYLVSLNGNYFDFFFSIYKKRELFRVFI